MEKNKAWSLRRKEKERRGDECVCVEMRGQVIVCPTMCVCVCVCVCAYVRILSRSFFLSGVCGSPAPASPLEQSGTGRPAGWLADCTGKETVSIKRQMEDSMCLHCRKHTHIHPNTHTHRHACMHARRPTCMHSCVQIQ